MKENDNIYDAKKSLKSHIKFFETIKHHLDGTDAILQSRAMFTAWCLHNYMNNQLINDIEKAMNEQEVKTI